MVVLNCTHFLLEQLERSQIFIVLYTKIVILLHKESSFVGEPGFTSSDLGIELKQNILVEKTTTKLGSTLKYSTFPFFSFFDSSKEKINSFNCVSMLFILPCYFTCMTIQVR